VIGGWLLSAKHAAQLERLCGVVQSAVLLALSKAGMAASRAYPSSAACHSAGTPKAAIFRATQTVMLKSAASQYRPSAKLPSARLLHQAQLGV